MGPSSGKISLYRVTGLKSSRAIVPSFNDFEVQDDGEAISGRAAGARFFPYTACFETEKLIAVSFHSRESLLRATFVKSELQKAKRLVSIPFAQLQGLTEGHPPGDRPVAPVYVFSAGRSGSTLVSKLCNSVDFTSVSEPEIFFSLLSAASTTKHARGRALLRQVTHASTAMILSALEDQDAVIKLQAQTSAIAPLLLQASPHASGVMLLREPISWASSAIRAFDWSPDYLVGLLETTYRAITRCNELGRPLTVVRYEDVSAQPAEFLKLMAKLRSLPVPDHSGDALAAAMLEDSQGDTDLSRAIVRDKPLNQNNLDDFAKKWEHRARDLAAQGLELFY
ncbi:MAG: hypothetical protein AAGI11_08195 [Pseudomonadota bacterium]